MDEEKGLRKPVGVERGGAAASTKRVPQRSEDCLSDWTLPPLLAGAPVFMFSGQGSQKPGMGGDLLAVKEVKETFSCASDVLGYDVADLVLNADPDELNDTRNAQPALCVLSVGIARALMARGVQPAAVLGFSLGQVSVDNLYRDYYIWKKPKEGKEPNNWGSCFGGPAWEYEESSGEYYLHLFSVKQPDLNWENPQVRREVYRMMNWWLDKGVDGFRMDVISLISKDPDFPDGPAGITGYAAFNYCANGPRVHEYLQEMRREVLDGRDTITVGECSGVTLEEALKYASCDGKELSMVFQFEHVDLDFDEKGNKWTDRKCRLTELKEVLSRWQTGLYGRAWNSLFWCNHDQPRVVSRFGNDSPEYREVSAKMLAVCLHMMQGTPYIYQGEELGMTNVPFKGIADFRDLDSINAYWELTGKGIFKEEEMLRFLRYKSRDNARTPMQWDDSPNAGFTEGEPWIMVNPNYGEINAADQIGREDSVFSFYKELVKLRKEKPVIVNGEYRLLDPESEDVFVYERSFHEEHLLVVCSFAEKELLWRLQEKMAGQAAKRVIGNYEGQQWGPELMLRPYEASVWEWTKGE